MAIDGDTIVAGAPGHAVGASASQGVLHTFARTGGAARTQSAELSAADGTGNDRLGSSVAIDGDTIVGGAPNSVSWNIRQGSAYTFTRSGATTRTQTAKLTAVDGAGGNGLGSSVAINGNTIVAGAPGVGRDWR